MSLFLHLFSISRCLSANITLGTIISSIIAMPKGLSILGRVEVTNMAVGPSAPPIMPTFDICSFLLKNYFLFSTTGTGASGVMLSSVTVQSTAQMRTPAAAASRSA